MDKNMIYEFIKENFNSESIIFEIGAHFGSDTEKIYHLTSGATIVAFEPDPRNFEMLKKRDIGEIATLENLAISDCVGEAEFYLSNGSSLTGYELFDKNEWSASSSLKEPLKHLERHPWVKFDKKVIVETISLDRYCRWKRIKGIDFIWMDVQGAEDLVLKGAQTTLLTTKYLYTEFCNEELYKGEPNLEQIKSLLPGQWSLLFFEGENVLFKNDGI
jgi:FkbM family methyltransferase